jgi:hypothetical protein
MNPKFWLRIVRGGVAGLVLPSMISATIAAATAASYELSWHTIAGGGVSSTTAGNFTLGATIGQATANPLSGGSYALGSGFWTEPASFVPGALIADCVFNWAERVYPNLFAPAGAVSQTLVPPYYYRYYAGTNAYLGSSSADSRLYYFGPATGNTVFDVGPLSYWWTTAGCQ